MVIHSSWSHVSLIRRLCGQGMATYVHNAVRALACTGKVRTNALRQGRHILNLPFKSVTRLLASHPKERPGDVAWILSWPDLCIQCVWNSDDLANPPIWQAMRWSRPRKLSDKLQATSTASQPKLYMPCLVPKRVRKQSEVDFHWRKHYVMSAETNSSRGPGHQHYGYRYQF